VAKPNYVYLLRHGPQVPSQNPRNSWDPEAHLAPSAQERIKHVARLFISLGGGEFFSSYRHSPLIRAKETCEGFKQVLGWQGKIQEHVGLGPGEPEEWDRTYCLWKEQQPDPNNPRVLSAEDCYSLWPELCKREGARVLAAVRDIAAQLPAECGQRALAVSHNPLISLAEAEACGGKIATPDVKHCQFLCFACYADGSVVAC
jgi:phosphohistidine phosphatase SixA